MSEEQKTHYRKAFDSPYLGAADVVDPIVLTIKCVRLEIDHTKKTKDYFNTAHFVEREIRPGEALKPMILNATNSKMVAQITGSKWIDDWNDVPVTVYVDPNVSFGREKVEGLRLSRATERPRSASPELVREAEAAAAKGTPNLREWWTAQTEQNRQLLALRFKMLKQTAASADAMLAQQTAGAAQ